MKKYLLILLLPLLLGANTISGSLLKGATCTGAAGASCTGATNQLESLTAGSVSNFGASSVSLWKASEIAYAGTTGTLCKLVVTMKCTTENCVQIVTGKLYSNDPTGDGGAADGVGSLIASCTGTYDSAALGTSNADISLTSCYGTLTNGTKYWLVLNADDYDGTDYLHIATDSTCTTEKNAYGSDGASWTYGTGTCYVFQVYILE